MELLKKYFLHIRYEKCKQNDSFNISVTIECRTDNKKKKKMLALI